MKKLLFLFTIFCVTLSQAQTSRNDNYSALGIITSFNEIPFGFSVYTLEKDEKIGFFSELKLNRLSFDSSYEYLGNPEPRDQLRIRDDEGEKNMIKMINLGTVINPQKYGVMQWDVIDIDFCVGLGYIQDFRYRFYNDYGGIEENEEENIDYAKPLGKYYVNHYNKNGVNLKVGANLSFENKKIMLHFGYDLKPKTFALGVNWKVK